MCGICGIRDYSSVRNFDEGAIRLMCSELRHRGPDDEGIYLSKDKPFIGLGHRRLSIIDLSAAGSQPFSNEDNTIRLVFNGEVYNFKDLRRDLQDKGHYFKSSTDTEAVVHLYEEYGDECVRYIRGMFAFALWDERNNKLLLARDRVGKKPLLYYYKNNRFVFSSEFASLLACGFIEKRINYEAVDYYLTFGYIPAPFTIYEDVFKLPPASILVLEGTKMLIKEYWSLDYGRKLKISEAEAAEETLRLLEESVKIRLYSDVPLGVFLSGGIDSSTVVALMSRLGGPKVKTFSIGFEEGNYSELRYAVNIADRFDTEHHELIIKPKAMEILPILVERYGEPYADSSCVPTFYVAQETKRYVTVALNGDGGDESFAGYDRYRAMLAAEVIRNIPCGVSRCLSYLSRLLPDSAEPRNNLRRIKRFFNALQLSQGERYLRWVSIFSREQKNQIYSSDFPKQIAGADPFKLLSPFLDERLSLGLLDKLLSADVRTYLPYDLLVKVDIASMANSLEARSPFLDHKLMEFTARLPSDYKIRKGIKKYLLKKIIREFIPQENVNRRKMGFGVPVGNWFRNELKDLLSETILSKSAFGRGYFKPEAVSTMVKAHIERKTDYSFQLWALLMLELWHKRFIDNNA